MNEQPTPPGASDGSEFPPRSLLQSAVETATARIQVIIEAAEKAAAGIVEDAEAQARGYLEESQARADQIADQRAQEMSALSDSLIQQAETVKRQSDDLIRALDRAKQQVGGRFPSEAAVEPASVSHLKPVEPSPAPLGQPAGSVSQPPPGGPAGTPAPDSARLLATQMAVAGNSRAEIERHLRNEFDIQDPGPMLDAILGREG